MVHGETVSFGEAPSTARRESCRLSHWHVTCNYSLSVTTGRGARGSLEGLGVAVDTKHILEDVKTEVKERLRCFDNIG